LTINDIIWKQQFVDKIEAKHGVSIEEVEEVFSIKPLIRKVAKGQVNGEDVYAAYAYISNGRYLVVFFVNKRGNKALPVSARDMDKSERKYYGKQRQN